MIILDKLLGIGETLTNRLVPDVNKQQDQAHEGAMKQGDITAEGERQRNYFTPRSILMYGLSFSVLYGIVIQPLLFAFGVPLPAVDFIPALKLLIGMLGLVG